MDDSRFWAMIRPGVRGSAQEFAVASEYSDVPLPMGDATMLEIFSANPWLVAVAEIAFVPLVGVVVGIVCISCNVCRRKVRLAQFDFELKRDMLQRGMSAEDIRTVIEAGRGAKRSLQPDRPGNGDVRPSHAFGAT